MGRGVGNANRRGAQRTTFLIPIVTPSFFESTECRKELIEFVGEAKSLGVEELVLPIYYVTVPELEDEEPADEAMAIIKRTQWEDLRDVRLKDESDPDHRARVARLAERLIEIAEAVEATQPASPPLVQAVTTDAVSAEAAVDAEDDEGGLLDRMAAGEEAMPKVAEALAGFGADLNELNERAQDATREMDEAAARGTFAARLAVANRLANRLAAPAERIEERAQQYVSLLSEVDPGVLTMIRLAAEQPESEQEGVEEFVSVIREMTAAGRQAAGQLEELAETLDDTAKFSRELRRPLKRIQVAVRNVADAQAIMDRWEQRIDEVHPHLAQSSDSDDGEDGDAVGTGNADAG